jgi:hypothetical protein
MIVSGVSLLPVFLVGLAGSVHCVGMCGGIVTALSTLPQDPRATPGAGAATLRAFPVPVATIGTAPAAAMAAARVLAYNGGRIGSYALAGALAGGASGLLQRAPALAWLPQAAYWLANLMLLALGLYLMNAWRGLAQVERLGQHLWQRLRPLTRSLMPADTPARMAALGALWGWLPCGMVYSMLTTAMLSGSALRGAAIMLAFGLGTLPMLALLGAAGQGLRPALQAPRVQRAAGLIVLAFAVAGLARAAFGIRHAWLDALCLAGGAA